MKNKLFIIQKYVVAPSIKKALEAEKHIRPDEIWLDDEWKKQNKPNTDIKKIGYETKN